MDNSRIIAVVINEPSTDVRRQMQTSSQFKLAQSRFDKRIIKVSEANIPAITVPILLRLDAETPSIDQQIVNYFVSIDPSTQA